MRPLPYAPNDLMQRFIVLLAILPATAANAAPAWSLRRDLHYGPGAAELADVYLQNSGVHPAVIVIHGGGWEQGDKDQQVMKHHAVEWAQAGYHVIAINYRLTSTGSPQDMWPAQIQDAQLAVRWIRAHAAEWRINPTKIAAHGRSAGAHLALFLGSLKQIVPGDRAALHPRIDPSVTVVADDFGPTDLTKPRIRNTRWTRALFGGVSYYAAPAAYGAASPVNYVSGQSAPVCIAHGKLDEVVPIGQSHELAAALARFGVPFRSFWFNGGHGFGGTSKPEKDAIDQWMVGCVSGYSNQTR